MEQNNQIVAAQKSSAVTNFMNPATMESSIKMCKMFTNSLLVPEMYRTGGVVKQGESKDAPAVTMTEEQATANVFLALDMSTRMGVNPLMVMQNLYIVKGKPSWSSSFLIATVNTCGRFKPLKFMLALEKNADGTPQMVEDSKHNRYFNTSCVAYTCPINVPEDKENVNMLTSTKITMKMAIEEGWLEKYGSKWKTMPEQMLRYRAAAFWVRTYAPEISMGMYTTDEMQDIQDVDAVEMKPDFSQANAGMIDMEAEMARVEEQTKEPSMAQVMEEQGNKDWKKAAAKQNAEPTDAPF